MKKTGAQLKLVMSRNETPQPTIENLWTPLSTIDLFCGAGGTFFLPETQKTTYKNNNQYNNCIGKISQTHG